MTSRAVPSHRAVRDGARSCVAVGAIVLLVGNLIPLAGAKGVVLVIGEVFVIAGLVGLAIAALLKSRSRPRKRTLDGRPR